MVRNAVSGGGFDVSLIFSNLVLLGSLGLAAIGWFIAFIGQIVAEARGITNVVVSTPSDRLGVLWFGIFVQLGLLLGVAATLATDGIAVHRLQLSAWTAVGLVFAVIGIDKGIYSDYRQNGSLHAMAAGYFLVTIANVIWLFFFTAEEDSAVYALLSSLGSGGLSGPGGRAGSRGMRGGNGSLSGGAISGPTGTSGFGTGFAAGSSSGGGYTQAYNNPSTGDITQGVAAPSAAMKSSHSLRSNAQSNAPGRAAGAGVAAPQSDFGGQSSHHQPTVPGSPASSRPAGTVEGEPTPGYGYRARALYAYQANADDPTEISFSKGEILDIVDNSGKWWQARKPTGETGIVPSNYMQLL